MTNSSQPRTIASSRPSSLRIASGGVEKGQSNLGAAPLRVSAGGSNPAIQKRVRVEQGNGAEQGPTSSRAPRSVQGKSVRSSEAVGIVRAAPRPHVPAGRSDAQVERPLEQRGETSRPRQSAASSRSVRIPSGDTARNNKSFPPSERSRGGVEKTAPLKVVRANAQTPMVVKARPRDRARVTREETTGGSLPAVRSNESARSNGPGRGNASMAPVVRRRREAEVPAFPGNRQRRPSIPDVSGVHLEWYKEYDLKELYPPSALLFVQDSLVWLVTACVMTSMYVFVYGPGLVGDFYDPVQHISSLATRFSIVAAMVMMVYYYLFEHTKKLILSGFRLVLTKGVFRRLHGSLALGGIGQVYVKQRPIDVIFNLYRVQLYVPMTPNESLTVIRGLTREQAYHLQDFFNRELNRQMFVSGDAIKAEEQARSAAAPDVRVDQSRATP